jgi:hypothetical protein
MIAPEQMDAINTPMIHHCNINPQTKTATNIENIDFRVGKLRT